MFTSTCHFVQRRVYNPHPNTPSLGRQPPRQTPQRQTPLGRHTPLGRDRLGQTPHGQTPLRRPLQQTVRILLECILDCVIGLPIFPKQCPLGYELSRMYQMVLKILNVICKNNLEICPKVYESGPDKSVKIHALTINPTEKIKSSCIPHT